MLPYFPYPKSLLHILKETKIIRLKTKNLFKVKKCKMFSLKIHKGAGI